MTGSMWTCSPGTYVHITLGVGWGGGGIWEDTCRPRVTDANDMQYKGPLNFVTLGRMFDCCM